MTTDFYWRAVREYREPGGLPHIEQCRDGDEPEMYGVYRRNELGQSEWIADFLEQTDAEAFVSFKRLTT